MNKVLRISLVVCLVLLCGMQRASGQWVQTGLAGNTVSCLASSGKVLFAGTKGSGVFASTNDGTNWIAVNNGLPDLHVQALNVSPDTLGYLYACTDSGIFLSTDIGTNWLAKNTGLTNLNVRCLAFNGSDLYAGTGGGGVFTSKNRGGSWTAANNGLPDNYVNAIEVIKTILFAGTQSSGVFISYDSSTNWGPFNADLTSNAISALKYIDGWYLLAGTIDKGIFHADWRVNHWASVNTGLNATQILTFFQAGLYTFAGTNGGIYYSTREGFEWVQDTTGLTNKPIPSIQIGERYLFAGSLNAGVWKRSLSEIIAGTEDQHEETPSTFFLHQNYPNPFLQSTTISFTIPYRSFASLKVFDMMGREISTLVSGDLDIGQHSYQWTAEGLRSGVYLCRLQAGSQVATQKLSLLR